MASELVLHNDTAVPAIIARSGGNARFAYEEFFKATINNPHTRRAYGRIVDRFLAWCQERAARAGPDHSRPWPVTTSANCPVRLPRKIRP